MIGNILEQQIFLTTLISIMIIVGVFKTNHTLDGVYSLARKYITNTRLFVFIASTIYGILPVPGRIGIATGMFDTCTDKTSDRKDLGVLAYLSTHHYYLWSPIEKSVIIVLASTGLGYFEFLKLMSPYIAVMLVMIMYYTFFVMKPPKLVDMSRGRGSIIDPMLLFTGVGSCCTGVVDVRVFFPLYALYTIIKYRPKNIHKFIDWKLIGVAALVITASTYIKSHTDDILNILSIINTQYGLHVALIASFLAALVLGSSSKFAAITSMMVAVYGVMYLPIFYIFDFCGYLLSPAHKCVHIGKLFFRTKLVAFYKVVGIITLILILISIINTMMLNE